MAASMANPQASAPQPQGGDAGASQSNPLVTNLAGHAREIAQIAQQNTVVQPELMQAARLLVMAISKVQQASSSAPQAAPAPPQQ